MVLSSSLQLLQLTGNCKLVLFKIEYWKVLRTTSYLVSLSSQLYAGWMADMLYLERCSLEWMWFIRLKLKADRTAHLRARL